jgi:hypothetical protein
MLLTRQLLTERHAQLKAEIARIEDNLATRKRTQRAEGILIARGVAPAVAKRWISQQSCRTGLSKSDVADRIIAYDQAIGLSQQKIAGGFSRLFFSPPLRSRPTPIIPATSNNSAPRGKHRLNRTTAGSRSSASFD